MVRRLFIVAVAAAATWASPDVWAQQGRAPASRLFDATQLVADVQALSSDQMEGRALGSAGNARARQLLVARFKAVGLSPVGTAFEWPYPPTAAAAGRGRPGGVNVIGRVVGTRWPDRSLVVSAHYDHVGVADGRVFNGANDNASGAAALAAIASYFVAHRPSVSVIFVAFDGEEDGLGGSRAFVRTPPVPRSEILLNLNFDMIAREATRTLIVSGTARYPRLIPSVQRVSARAPIAVKMAFDGGASGDDWSQQSDQWAFIEADLPGLYVGVDDSALHHHPDDDFGSLMLDFYVGAVESGIELVKEFDAWAASERPRAR